MCRVWEPMVRRHRLPDVARLDPSSVADHSLHRGLVMRCRYTRDPTHARMAVHRLRSAPDRVRQQDCGITLRHQKWSAGESDG